MTAAGVVAPRRLVAIGCALVGVYLLPRLALLWRFPPHTDESLFAYWANAGYEDPSQRFLPLSLGQNPMQEWLGMGLIALGLEPLTSLRVLSLLAGLVTMGVVAWFARELAGDWAAIAAAALWAILPFGLVYGVVGVADPLIAALSAVAMVLQLSIARQPRLGLALLLGVVLGVGVLTKLTMLSAVWLTPLSALLFDWRRDRLAQRLVRWAGALALAGIVAWSMYQVLRLSPLWPGLDEARERALARHGLGEFLDAPGYWIERNWTQYRLALRGYLTLPIILAATIGLALTIRRSTRVGLFLLGWIVIPLAAVIALAGEPFLRWLLGIVPPLAVAAGVGTAELVRAAMRLVAGRGERVVRVAAIAVCVVLALPALVWGAETLRHPSTREYPSRDDVDFVQAYSAGGPLPGLVAELERVPGKLTVATMGNGLEYVFLALRREPIDYVLAVDRDPRALLAVRNTRDPLPVGPAPLAWRTIRSWQRPRNGLPVTLAERGVSVGGRFAASPTALRALLGGSAAVERLAAGNAPVRSWLDAWEAAYHKR